jgi:hypothetical protein
MQDKDGHAVVVALKSIGKEEEVLFFLFLFFGSNHLVHEQEKKMRKVMFLSTAMRS